MTPSKQPNRQPDAGGARAGNSDASGLIELLDQQRLIYLQLQKLGRSQTQLVAAGQAEPLLDLLAQRQTLIDNLSQLNARVEPFKREWPRVWSSLDAAMRARVSGLIDHVQNLLDQIVEQDSRDRASLTLQRDRIGSELGQLRKGSTVHRAYGRRDVDPDAKNRYTDQQG